MPIAGGIYYFSHLEDERSKPPVILIHGAGGNHLHWPPEVRRIPGQRIYAPDLPGHGRSSGIGRQSVGDYARIILDFMDELDISKAVLIGHSMGAAIALALGLDHARRTLGLGLLSGGARLVVSPELLDNTSSASTLPLAIKAISKWAFSPATSQRLKELALARMAETRPTVLHGDFLACNEFDVIGRLKKIRVPTLVLCGRDDRMTPMNYSEYLASQIELARLVRIENAGHMVMLEKPQEVMAEIQAFIASIDYQPGN